MHLIFQGWKSNICIFKLDPFYIYHGLWHFVTECASFTTWHRVFRNHLKTHPSKEKTKHKSRFPFKTFQNFEGCFLPLPSIFREVDMNHSLEEYCLPINIFIIFDDFYKVGELMIYYMINIVLKIDCIWDMLGHVEM